MIINTVIFLVGHKKFFLSPKMKWEQICTYIYYFFLLTEYSFLVFIWLFGRAFFLIYWNCSCKYFNYLCIRTCRVWLSFLFGFNTRFISFAGWFSMKKPSLRVCFTINRCWQIEMSGSPSRWEQQQTRPLLVPFLLLHTWQETRVPLCLLSNVELYCVIFSSTHSKHWTNIAQGVWNWLRMANFPHPNFNFLLLICWRWNHVVLISWIALL